MRNRPYDGYRNFCLKPPVARAFFFLIACVCCAQAGTPNWSGDYAPCNRHSDLLNSGYVDLGVRLSSSNAILNQQFSRAMNFWAKILDIDWHEEDSEICSLQLVDGGRSLFDTAGIAARSQLPDRTDFQGWIAFNPASKLSETEMFVISVHEIGHLLGLNHNQNAHSVMFFLDLDSTVLLDATDLRALAALHKLRSGVMASQKVPLSPAEP